MCNTFVRRVPDHSTVIWYVLCLVTPFFWTPDLWTQQPGSHRRNVSQDLSTTFLVVRCLAYFLSREGFSRSFPSSTVKSNVFYPRMNRSPLVGYPSSCDCTEIRTLVPMWEGFEDANWTTGTTGWCIKIKLKNMIRCLKKKYFFLIGSPALTFTRYYW